MICTWSCSVSRAFLFVLSRSFPFSFIWMQLCFPSAHRAQSTWGNQFQGPSQRLVGIREQHPGMPAAPGHLGPVPSSTPDLLPDLHQPLPCSRPLFFSPLLPFFCLAPFSCNLFRAGTRCVCSYKGLRTMCPRWFVQVPSRQPRGFILRERNS